MVNIGLIGSMGSIGVHVRKLKEIPGLRMIGKSSVGLMEAPGGLSLPVPEFNRQELIEASDAVVVDQPALLSPELLKQAVRSGKHFYFSEFPALAEEEVSGLIKLAGEAGSGICIRNPLADEPLTRWIVNHRKEPLYLSLFCPAEQVPDRRAFLLQHLFYAVRLFDAPPRKIRVSGTHHPDPAFSFLNVRLEYATFSAFNLELFFPSKGSPSLRAFMPGLYLSGELSGGKAWLNHQELTPYPPAGDSLTSFLDPAGPADFCHRSNLEAYLSALRILSELLRKTDMYTPWL